MAETLSKSKRITTTQAKALSSKLFNEIRKAKSEVINNYQQSIRETTDRLLLNHPDLVELGRDSIYCKSDIDSFIRKKYVEEFRTLGNPPSFDSYNIERGIQRDVLEMTIYTNNVQDITQKILATYL